MRNFSLEAYFNSKAARHTPRYRFGSSSHNWREWRPALLSAVKSSLGRLPSKVPLNPQIELEWTEDGLIKQRIVLDVEDEMSLHAYVFRPKQLAIPGPAILACHGHGPYGKDAVIGNRGNRDRRTNVDDHNYDYGLQMAKAGFVTMAIDSRGFGECDDRRKPFFHNTIHERDACNVHFLRASVLGMALLGLNLHDAMCAIDYLSSLAFVDVKRLGVMGLSFGGTMTTWLAACDERIRAADIICYSDRFADFGIRDGNFCGSQMTPGLFELCDVPDLQGLIAPRPLLVEIGIYDDCFLVDSAMSCFGEVEKIYAAANAADKLHLDLFEGGHRWGGNKSIDFFRKNL